MRLRGSLIDKYLDSSPNWSRINHLGNEVFKQGKLDLVDELLIYVIPIINIVYHRNIKWLDDRYYAEEDLLQDAIIEVYNDMKLHWDKYIHVDNYPKYFEMIAKNIMINAVHNYHNYYRAVELDYNNSNSYTSLDSEYLRIELRMVKETLDSDMLTLTKRLAGYRGKYAKVLLLIADELYLNNSSNLDSLESKLRVLGVKDKTYNFLKDHVVYLHKLSYNYHKALLKGNRRMELTIKDIIRRYESPTYGLLARNYSDSIIPEIYAEFGSDITRKFVKLFSGRQVDVPDYQDLCDDLLGGTVYSIAKGDRNNLYQFASDNGLSFRSLARIYDKTSKYYEKL